MRQLLIAAGQIVLQRANGEDQMPGESKQVIPDRSQEQEHRLLIPLVVKRYPQHGIDSNQQRAKGDSGIALAQPAQQDKDAGGEHQPDGEKPRPGEEQLHRRRGDKKADQRNNQIAQPTGETVIQIGQRPGDDAQRQRNGQLHVAQPPGQGGAATQGNKDPGVVQPGAVESVAANQRA